MRLVVVGGSDAEVVLLLADRFPNTPPFSAPWDPVQAAAQDWVGRSAHAAV